MSDTLHPQSAPNTHLRPPSMFQSAVTQVLPPLQASKHEASLALLLCASRLGIRLTEDAYDLSQRQTEPTTHASRSVTQKCLSSVPPATGFMSSWAKRDNPSRIGKRLSLTSSLGAAIGENALTSLFLSLAYKTAFCLV